MILALLKGSAERSRPCCCLGDRHLSRYPQGSEHSHGAELRPGIPDCAGASSAVNIHPMSLWRSTEFTGVGASVEHGFRSRGRSNSRVWQDCIVNSSSAWRSHSYDSTCSRRSFPSCMPEHRIWTLCAPARSMGNQSWPASKQSVSSSRCARGFGGTCVVIGSSVPGARSFRFNASVQSDLSGGVWLVAAGVLGGTGRYHAARRMRRSSTVMGAYRDLCRAAT